MPTANSKPQMLQLVFERTEMKFRLDASQRARLLEAMAAHMIPDPHGESTMRSVYYDTPSDLLIRRSIDKPFYKEKIRTRSYGAPVPGKPTYCELKKKYDGVVYKRRSEGTLQETHALAMGIGNPRTQVEREIDFSAKRYGGLQPSMFIAYDRHAFYADGDADFRMTFDRNVRARWTDVRLDGSDDGNLVVPGDATLLEVKTSRAIPLWLVDFLSAEGLRKSSFSKYGTAYAMKLGRAPRIATAPATAKAPVRSRVASPRQRLANLPAVTA